MLDTPTPVLVKWAEPPSMDTGAPMPAIYSDVTGLVCAYSIGALHPEQGATALLYFEGVLQYRFGYPNDEALRGHPLRRYGLESYEFQLVENSPLIAQLDRQNEAHDRHVPGSYVKRYRHWIITFHDETLEVVARSARVIGITETEPSTAVRAPSGTLRLK